MAQPLMHNGKSYSNADTWRSAKAMEAPKPAMGEPGGEGEEPSAVAKAHGPAVQVNIEHEHEMGSHHVDSVHPDGHEHHSDHGSAEEAHETGKKLAGIGGEGMQE